jgi:YgiT-type zinc finger domain-containing protein
MECSIAGCPGRYEERRIVHTVRRQGEIVVVDGVPAEVCNICGDVLLRPETIRHLEDLLAGRTAPVSAAPLYEYV